MLRVTTAVVLVLLWCACGPAPMTPEGPHLLWSDDPQSLANPFPDERLISGGALKLRPGWYTPFLAKKVLTGKVKTFFDTTGATLEKNVTGFGAFGGTLVLPSEALDPKSLAGRVARLQKTATGWQVLEANVAVQHVSDVLAAQGVTPVPDGIPEYVFARPGVPLLEGSEGALVFLSGITTAAGKPLEPTRQWVATKPDLAALSSALGVTEKDVLLALPQHAPVLSSDWPKLAVWADAHPGTATVPAKALAPDDNNGTRPVGTWLSSDSDWSTMLAWVERHPFGKNSSHPGSVTVGEFSAKDLRDTSDHFVAGAVADPTTARDVSLRFVLVLPKGPRPTGGWPVVLGLHGVGGRNTPRVNTQDAFCIEWAEPLTAAGLGCLGIDAPSHGSRGAFTSFFSVGDLPALRDRFREMSFDLLQLERLVATLDVDHDGTPDLAPNPRVFGNSLGGIMGAGFVPLANHVTSAVLNVPGGGLSNLLESPDLHDLLGLLLVAQTDLPFNSAEYHAAFPVFRVGAQPLFEPADPVNLAHLLPASRAVLVQEGLGDQTIPNFTTENLAAALGATPLAATSGSTPLRALSRTDPARFLSPQQLSQYNPHGVMWDILPTRTQAMTFLSSDGTTLTGL